MPRAAYPNPTDVVNLFVGAQIIADPTAFGFATNPAPTAASAVSTVGGVSTVTVGSSAFFAPGDTILIDSGVLLEARAVVSVPDATHVTVSALVLPHDDEAPVTKSLINWAQFAAEVPGEIESRTGRKFIALPATRTFDAPATKAAILNLRADLCSDTAGAPVVVTLQGRTMVVNSDYYLGPDNSDADGKPWQWVEFVYSFTDLFAPSLRKAVTVSGPWGYSLQVPDDVWHACVKLAGIKAAPQVALGISRGLAQWKEGNEEEMYGGRGTTGPLGHEVGLWQADVERVIKNKLRVQSWG